MRIFRAWRVLFVLLLLSSSHLLFFANQAAIALPGQVILCSVYSSGQQFTYVSRAPDITADGRYVVFESFVDIGQGNRMNEVFWRDILTGVTRSISELAPSLHWATEPRITTDGRYIVFTATSEASSPAHVYRADLSTGTVVLCSCNASSEAADQGGSHPGISADGRYVVFSSVSTNLVQGLSANNIYRKDLQTGAIECCSCDALGQALGDLPNPPDILNPSVSFDGRFVCFDFRDPTSANPLVGVYRKNMQTGGLLLCSSDSDGNSVTGDPGESCMSGDGRYVGFASHFTGGVVWSVYRKDLETGELRVGSTDASGIQENGRSTFPCLSHDGRYMAFASTSTNILPGADSGYSQAFRKDFLTGEIALCSCDPVGRQGDGDSVECRVSPDGRFFVFSSIASNLIAGDNNIYADIFRREMASDEPPPSVPVGFDHLSYLAEGFTGPGFQEYLTIGNPGGARTSAQVLYFFQGGGWAEQDLQVPGGSRASLDVNAAIGAGKQVSVRIAADQPVVAERPEYFDYVGKTGGHVTTAVASPSNTWHFAEGYTGPGFDEYVCAFNPGDIQADLTFRFQVQGEIVKVGTVGAKSRATFPINQLLGQNLAASLTLESSQPVVAERAMYFDYGGWTGGSCVMGTTALGKEYYFAEGTTRQGFDEYLCLQNPNSAAIDVTCTFQVNPAGLAPVVVKVFRVEPSSRLTAFVPDWIGRNRDASVALKSDFEFLAERPMYFDYTGYGANWTGGHCVMGAPAPASKWFFAEGCTLAGFHEYLCLQNPGAADATIKITYLTQETGALPVQTSVVPAHSRVTSLVNVAAGAGYQLSCLISVVNGPDIVVERPMYFEYNGWNGGHDALGVAPSMF